MARGTPNFTLRLEPEIRQSLEQIAKDQGVTLAYVVRLALAAFIERQRQK